jgi:hypothetical protein
MVRRILLFTKEKELVFHQSWPIPNRLRNRMLRPISFLVVKAVLPFISALVLAFVAAEGSASDKPSDETIRSQIPGAWISQETLDGQPTTLAVEYRSDGTFGASARVTKGRYSIKLVLTGTWRVHNGILISHTQATGAPPRVAAYEVIAVNESMLVLRDRDGSIVVKRRAK